LENARHRKKEDGGERPTKELPKNCTPKRDRTPPVRSSGKSAFGTAQGLDRRSKITGERTKPKTWALEKRPLRTGGAANEKKEGQAAVRSYVGNCPCT